VARPISPSRSTHRADSFSARLPSPRRRANRAPGWRAGYLASLVDLDPLNRHFVALAERVAEAERREHADLHPPVHEERARDDAEQDQQPPSPFHNDLLGLS